jgi:hypothetical protein
MKSKQESRNLLDVSKTGLDTWEQAINDARQMIEDSKEKIARLKKSIKTFERLRDAGEPWPGTSEVTEKGKGATSTHNL